MKDFNITKEDIDYIEIWYEWDFINQLRTLRRGITSSPPSTRRRNLRRRIHRVSRACTTRSPRRRRAWSWRRRRSACRRGQKTQGRGHRRPGQSCPRVLGTPHARPDWRRRRPSWRHQQRRHRPAWRHRQRRRRPPGSRARG